MLGYDHVMHFNTFGFLPLRQLSHRTKWRPSGSSSSVLRSLICR